MATISVVVPTYNRSQLLARTIHSYCQETVAELVIVNDRSKPEQSVGYERLLADCERRYREVRFRLITNEQNLGAARSRNVGAAHTASDYILFSDDDIFLPPGVLKQALSLARGVRDLGALGLGLVFASSPEEGLQAPGVTRTPRLNRRVLTGRFFAGPPSSQLVEVPFSWNPTLYRAAYLREGAIAFFHYPGNGYREETDPQIQAMKLGLRNFFAPGLRAVHVGSQNEGGQWSSGAFKKLRWYLAACRNNRLFLERHGQFLRQRGYLALPAPVSQVAFMMRQAAVLIR